MHILSIGFVVGADIYDVVLILNTDQAVEQFKHARVKLGAEVSVAAGPVGGGAGVEASRAASYSYTKSKGFYAGLALDGQVCVERGDEVIDTYSIYPENTLIILRTSVSMADDTRLGRSSQVNRDGLPKPRDSTRPLPQHKVSRRRLMRFLQA